jgi:hypothetical protein
MYLVLTSEDCARLRPETIADLIAQAVSRSMALETSTTPAPRAETVPGADDIDMHDVVDLTPDQVAEFMDGIHQQTVDGLRVFAENGSVIDARLLNAVGITNYSHFQGRVTKRTRTVTRKKRAFLIGWDNNWEWDENNILLSGRYAVTPVTYQSLRKFFGLD